jgi:hypothetical protein
MRALLEKFKEADGVTFKIGSQKVDHAAALNALSSNDDTCATAGATVAGGKKTGRLHPFRRGKPRRFHTPRPRRQCGALREQAEQHGPEDCRQKMEDVIAKLQAKAGGNGPYDRANGRRYLNLTDIGEIGLPNKNVFTGGVSFKVVGGGSVLVFQPPQNQSTSSYSSDYDHIFRGTYSWQNDDKAGVLKNTYEAYTKACADKSYVGDHAKGLPAI